MKINSILVFFHVGSNTGYAIEPLEQTFFNMAKMLVNDESNIHFAYTNMDKGHPRILPEHFKNVITFDYDDSSSDSLTSIYEYIKENGINVAFGFDQSVVNLPSYRSIRKAGVRCFISYYGAPMSSINSGMKLWLKKLQVKLIRCKPDHYIYESYAMAETAVFGRGLSQKDVSVVHTGVDTEKYCPAISETFYAHEKFGIPKNRNIIFYSGHMERRKGVHVIVKAAVELAVNRKREDIHFVITGNKNGEEKAFDEIYRGTTAENYITFGGYCDDLTKIIPSCHIGTIASVGWDSFPRSALEMGACGLPLLVSNLQGIPEAIEIGKTGFVFEPGNSEELAEKIEYFIDNPEIREQFSKNARARILEGFTLKDNEENLVKVVRDVVGTIR